MREFKPASRLTLAVSTSPYRAPPPAGLHWISSPRAPRPLRPPFRSRARPAAAGRAAPAVLTYALIEGIICQYLIQGTGLAMLELEKKILAPVLVGDTVHAEIEVLSVRQTSKGNRGIVKTRNDIVNQRGETVITYEATRMVAGKD